MLSTEISPFPGARVVTGLRTHARAARRTALVALSGSIALLASVQMLAERAPTREETLPFAVLALLVFLGAVPALAATQAVWGVRMRRVRRRELELYATSGGPLTRALSRLGVAACWVVTLLLGFTVPRLFRESGLYGAADALTSAVEVLTLMGYVAAVFFAAWWARGALATLSGIARSGRPPSDPWDPEPPRKNDQTQPLCLAPPYPGMALHRATRRAMTAARSPAALWSGSGLAVVALLGGRAHLWEPGTLTVCVLLTAALVCGVVTGE